MDVIQAFESASGMNLEHIGLIIMGTIGSCYYLWLAWVCKGVYFLYASNGITQKDLTGNILWGLGIVSVITFLLGI